MSNVLITLDIANPDLAIVPAILVAHIGAALALFGAWMLPATSRPSEIWGTPEYTGQDSELISLIGNVGDILQHLGACPYAPAPSMWRRRSGMRYQAAGSLQFFQSSIRNKE